MEEEGKPFDVKALKGGINKLEEELGVPTGLSKSNSEGSESNEATIPHLHPENKELQLNQATIPIKTLRSTEGFTPEMKRNEELAVETRAAFARETIAKEEWKNRPFELEDGEFEGNWEAFCEVNKIDKVEGLLDSEKAKVYELTVADGYSKADDFKRTASYMAGFEPELDENGKELNLEELSEEQRNKKLPGVVVEYNLGDMLTGMDKINFTAITKLKNMRVRAVVSRELWEESGQSVEEALRLSSRVVEHQGGWASQIGTSWNLSGDIIKEDKRAIFFDIEHPAQGDSQYLYPAEVEDDPFRWSLTNVLMCDEVTKRFMGLADEELTAVGVGRGDFRREGMNKKIVKIIHSRAAAAHLFDKSLNNPDISYIFVAPVLGHESESGRSGFNPYVARKIIPAALRIKRVLEGTETRKKIFEKPIGFVTDIMVNHLSGSEHTESVGVYGNSIQKAEQDKSIINLETTIGQLLDVKFPDLKDKVDFSGNRIKIIVFNKDNFVHTQNMLNMMKKKLGQNGFENCVIELNGDHHAHLTDGKAAKNPENVKNHDMVVGLAVGKGVTE